jgi:hypothetical protein
LGPIASELCYTVRRRFTPWWDTRGDCPNNCSFIAEDPWGALWMPTMTSLAAPKQHLIAYGGTLAFGAAHFFYRRRVVGAFIFMVVWLSAG